ncbi:MAG: hypothetical protein CMM99_04710 [Rickettsiales bacterium]|nr:hypothetical protein [Rickettsiales bacterium]
MGKNNKNKINIFFCINSLQKGGAEKQLNYISNFLSTNYNIFIFTLAGNKNYYKFNKNIKIYNLLSLFSIFFFIKKLLSLKPKLVFYILPKSYFFFGTILIFFPNIKAILMRRSLNYYQKNLIFKFYEIFLHRFTSFFICNSNSAKQELIKKEFVSKNKVLVIDNYIKIKNFKKKNINIKNKKFKILCIANFYKYKGHSLLIESLSLIKKIPWKLYLMGEERDFRRNDLKYISKKLGIYKRITFIKKIKKIHSYPNFSLGVSISKTESFPNAILEYFSLKLPVAAYGIGDIRRLVNNKNGKILKNRNPNYISKKINELYFDKKLALKSKYAFQKAIKFSKIKNTLKKYDNIIKALCVE